MSQGDWEKDRGAGSTTVRHDAGSRPARSSDPGTQTTRQQVGTGSRAPGRRLSVERVPGSSGRMKEGLGGWGGRRNFYSGSREAGITPSPQCDTTPAFQLKCMLRRERHKLCSRCTYRTIHVDGYKDLQNLQAELHAHRSDSEKYAPSA